VPNSPDGIVIERLGPEHWARLRALRLRALADAPDAFDTTWDEARAQREEHWREALDVLPTFFAVRDGSDLGMVRIARDSEAADTCWLLSLWVAPAARGLRVGDRLVEAAIEAARATGASRLLLDVADDNGHAVALYDRLGFVATGRRGHLPAPREHVREHERRLLLR